MGPASNNAHMFVSDQSGWIGFGPASNFHVKDNKKQNFMYELKNELQLIDKNIVSYNISTDFLQTSYIHLGSLEGNVNEMDV